MSIRPNSRKQVFAPDGDPARGGEKTYSQYGPTDTDDVEDGTWTPPVPAVFDDSEPPVEITPEVPGSWATNTRAITAEEQADWAAVEASDDRRSAKADLKNRLGDIRQVKKDAIARRDEHATSRDELDHETPDPAALNKWLPVDEVDSQPFDRTTGTNAQKIARLFDIAEAQEARIVDQAKLLNNLRKEFKKFYGDERLAAANDRDISKALIDLLKSGIDDLTPAEVAGDGTDGD